MRDNKRHNFSWPYVHSTHDHFLDARVIWEFRFSLFTEAHAWCTGIRRACANYISAGTSEEAYINVYARVHTWTASIALGREARRKRSESNRRIWRLLLLMHTWVPRVRGSHDDPNSRILCVDTSATSRFSIFYNFSFFLTCSLTLRGKRSCCICIIYH